MPLRSVRVSTSDFDRLCVLTRDASRVDSLSPPALISSAASAPFSLSALTVSRQLPEAALLLSRGRSEKRCQSGCDARSEVEKGQSSSAVSALPHPAGVSRGHGSEGELTKRCGDPNERHEKSEELELAFEDKSPRASPAHGSVMPTGSHYAVNDPGS